MLTLKHLGNQLWFPVLMEALISYQLDGSILDRKFYSISRTELYRGKAGHLLRFAIVFCEQAEPVFELKLLRPSERRLSVQANPCLLGTFL
jgi:hypothetical protein